MSAIILRLDAFRTSAPPQTDRLIALGNEQWARGLKLIPLPVMSASVPVVGRLNDKTQPGDCPQLED